MSKHKSVVLFDLDGCISDDWHRLPLLPVNGTCDADFKAYHDLCGRDKPMNLELVNEYLQAGTAIVFITTRPEAYAEVTMVWLQIHFGEYLLWDLLMRPHGVTLPSPQLKRMMIEAARGVVFDRIEHAYDDRDDVLGMYDAMGIFCSKLTYPASQGVPQLLEEMAKVYADRQATYGPSYLRFGNIAKALWPDGLQLNTFDEFVRHGILVQCITKIARYVNTPEGHADSARDLAVYAAMLLEQTDE